MADSARLVGAVLLFQSVKKQSKNLLRAAFISPICEDCLEFHGAK